MKRNMSNLDRALRAVAGILLLGWALLSQHPLHWWGLVGLVPLGTALIGFCPLYRLLGISTCHKPIARGPMQ